MVLNDAEPVFDFDTLWSGEFDSSRNRLIVISDRDFSVLHNVLRLAHFPTRVVNSSRSQLSKVGRLSDLQAWLDYVDSLEDTLMTDLQCSIENGLLAIADAMRQCCANGGGSITIGGSGTGGAGAIVSPPFDGSVGTPGNHTGDPPTGYDTWEDFDEDICNKAAFIVDRLIDDLENISAYQFAASATIEGIAIALAAGLLTPLAAPDLLIEAGLTVTAITMGIISSWYGDMATSLDGVRDDFICALFTADNFDTAVAQAQAVIFPALDDDMSDFEAGLSKQAITTYLNPDNLNILFEKTDRTYPAHDCSACLVPEGCAESLVGPYEDITLTIDDSNYPTVLVTSNSFYDTGSGQWLGGWKLDTTNFPSCTCVTLTDIEFLMGDPGGATIAVNWLECDGSYQGNSIPVSSIALPDDVRGFWLGIAAAEHQIRWTLEFTE